ncbi:hypothetical protein ADUPG1_008786 [Aduncisulcus paluster]|uniref:Uncharacterized protein n=1 Tax=Aduncisulcus paluster TaxID=2918883 RepID=A0ABQ5KT96_9EUKA|nr:hypothetical protein ADUPG1_008786 [Aduncisulcus paluster]
MDPTHDSCVSDQQSQSKILITSERLHRDLKHLDKQKYSSGINRQKLLRILKSWNKEHFPIGETATTPEDWRIIDGSNLKWILKEREKRRQDIEEVHSTRLSVQRKANKSTASKIKPLPIDKSLTDSRMEHIFRVEYSKLLDREKERTRLKSREKLHIQGDSSDNQIWPDGTDDSRVSGFDSSIPIIEFSDSSMAIEASKEIDDTESYKQDNDSSNPCHTDTDVTTSKNVMTFGHDNKAILFHPLHNPTLQKDLSLCLQDVKHTTPQLSSHKSPHPILRLVDRPPTPPLVPQVFSSLSLALSNLKIAILSHCSLTSIPIIRSPSLIWLDVSDNLIHDICICGETPCMCLSWQEKQKTHKKTQISASAKKISPLVTEGKSTIVNQETSDDEPPMFPPLSSPNPPFLPSSLPMSSLRVLLLHRNKIGSIREVEKLSSLTKLSCLSLSSNPLSRSHLHSTKKPMPNLSSLSKQQHISISRPLPVLAYRRASSFASSE